MGFTHSTVQPGYQQVDLWVSERCDFNWILQDDNQDFASGATAAFIIGTSIDDPIVDEACVILDDTITITLTKTQITALLPVGADTEDTTIYIGRWWVVLTELGIRSAYCGGDLWLERVFVRGLIESSSSTIIISRSSLSTSSKSTSSSSLSTAVTTGSSSTSSSTTETSSSQTSLTSVSVLSLSSSSASAISGVSESSLSVSTLSTTESMVSSANESLSSLSISTQSTASSVSSGHIAWSEIASSSHDWVRGSIDNAGTFFACVDGSKVYYSYSWGATIVSHTGSGGWTGVDCDQGGNYIIACNNRIWKLPTPSSSWTEIQALGDTDNDWRCVACDDDASFLVAGVYDYGIFKSSNGGINWSEMYPKGIGADGYWSCCDVDEDGSAILCAEYSGGGLYFSSNSGVSWDTIYGYSPYMWCSVRVLHFGLYLFAAGYQALIMSKDAGNTWTSIAPDAALNYIDIDASEDLSVIITCDDAGSVWLSYDEGSSWTEELAVGDHNFRLARSNAAGNKFLVGGLNTSLWTGRI